MRREDSTIITTITIDYGPAWKFRSKRDAAIIILLFPAFMLGSAAVIKVFLQLTGLR